MEVRSTTSELSVDQIYDEVLSSADQEKAYDLHMYVLNWVLSPNNLSQHGRAMFMYTCAHGEIGKALSVLMNEFSHPDSEILPTEPPLWIEWANYWQRGFDPNIRPHLEPSLDSIE